MNPGPFAYRPDRTVADANGIPLARCYADRNEDAHGPLFAASLDLLEAWEEWFETRDRLAELERNSDTTKRFDDALYAQERAEAKAQRAIAAVRGEG